MWPRPQSYILLSTHKQLRTPIHIVWAQPQVSPPLEFTSNSSSYGQFTLMGQKMESIEAIEHMIGTKWEEGT